MQDLIENRKLQYLLIANFCVLTCCVFNTSDEFRENFEFVEYPNDEFKQTVIRILCVDLAFCYTFEKSCKLMYLKNFETKEDDD